jgi:hypothetical protein
MVKTYSSAGLKRFDSGTPTIQKLGSNIGVEWLSPVLRILEVPISDLGAETG